MECEHASGAISWNANCLGKEIKYILKEATADSGIIVFADKVEWSTHTACLSEAEVLDAF